MTGVGLGSVTRRCATWIRRQSPTIRSPTGMRLQAVGWPSNDPRSRNKKERRPSGLSRAHCIAAEAIVGERHRDRWQNTDRAFSGTANSVGVPVLVSIQEMMMNELSPSWMKWRPMFLRRSGIKASTAIINPKGKRAVTVRVDGVRRVDRFRASERSCWPRAQR